MSKMAELDTAVTELQRCGESLVRVSDALRALFSGTEPQEDAQNDPPAPKDATKEHTTPNESVSPKEHSELSEPSESVTHAPAEPIAKRSLEDVRAVLAKKSVEGHTASVQALIRKFGAEKLSQVDPVHYTDLLRDAEVL